MGPFQNTPRDDIEQLLALTASPDEAVRAAAVWTLCPCHVKRNEPAVWDRILSLVDDPSTKVRSFVFHFLADGSPRERETEVVAAIERFQHDPDKRLRRRARQLLAQYRRSGRINAL
jgi:hypothetical protein